MSAGLLALLAGLFVVPLLLLWLGHRLRRREAPWHGVFWGAVIGHLVGMVVSVMAMHYPPVPWTGGWRAVVVHWAMLAGAAVGAGAGWVASARRRAGAEPAA